MSSYKPSFSAIVIDPEESAGRLLVARLVDLGGAAVWASSRSAAYALIAGQPPVDIVFFDPAPHRDLHMVAVDIRKHFPTFVYLVALKPDGVAAAFDKMVQTGTNSVLEKPASIESVTNAVREARSLVDLMHRLNDTDYDTKSGGGAISKSAFAQLFLSGLDRADRYGEQSFILQIKVLNLTQIQVLAGADAAQMVAASLAQIMARLRRQSDILGAIHIDEYALMLQRPAYATEPVEAALRFADQLGDQNLFMSLNLPVSVDVQITLMEVPTGQIPVVHQISIPKK